MKMSATRRYKVTTAAGDARPTFQLRQDSDQQNNVIFIHIPFHKQETVITVKRHVFVIKA